MLSLLIRCKLNNVFCGCCGYLGRMVLAHFLPAPFFSYNASCSIQCNSRHNKIHSNGLLATGLRWQLPTTLRSLVSYVKTMGISFATILWFYCILACFFLGVFFSHVKFVFSNHSLSNHSLDRLQVRNSQ